MSHGGHYERTVTVAVSVALVAACGSGSGSQSDSTLTSTAASADTAVAHDTTGALDSTAVVETDEVLDAELDIGGDRTMHIVCTGASAASGEPTVIFESGLGGSHEVWDDVVEELAGAMRTCAYDRAGLGLSDPGPTPTTTSAQVADLVALLSAAQVPPPYLFVAHSIGGYNVRVFADQHMEHLAGIVLVDARPPDVSRLWIELLPPEAPDDPQPLKDERLFVTSFEQNPSMNPESLDPVASADQALALDSLGDVPIVVLVAGEHDDLGLGPELEEQWAALWLDRQEAQAALSTKGRIEVVEDGEHDLPRHHPDVIAAAITEIFDAIGS